MRTLLPFVTLSSQVSDAGAGDFSIAVRLFSQALVIQPQNAACLSNRAFAYLRQDKFEAALADTEAVLSLPQSSASDVQIARKAQHRKGKALFGLGRLEEALDVLEDLRTHVDRCVYVFVKISPSKMLSR